MSIDILGHLSAIMALIVSLLAVITFIITRRKSAIEEGKHLQQIDQLKLDLQKAYDKIRTLQDKVQDGAIDMATIATKLENISCAILRIETKLDKHLIEKDE